MRTSLDHEKLEVYKGLPRIHHMDDRDFGSTACQCIRSKSTGSASTSVPLNIAEGNGKFTSPDRCRFFDNARGSALESAACLDVMVAKKFVSASEIETGKEMAVKIVSMLFGLIRANSDVRVFEEPESYRTQKDQKEWEQE